MSLARAWMRQLFGASGMALLVPGTIACALVVLAFAGGFSRFDSIGQALSGPAAPVGPANAGARASERLAQTLVTLGQGGFGGRVSGGVAVSTGSGGRGASHRAGSHGRTHGAGQGGRSGGGSRGGGSRGGGSGSGTGSRGGGGRGPGSGTPTPPSTPTPPTNPSVSDRIVSAVTAITAKLPGAVGSVATATLQSLGSTLNRVLPVPLGGKSL